MRNKENMECFKWYKNDRICWLCPYEEECIYEHELYKFADKLYCNCKYKERLTSDYYPKCSNGNVEKTFCSRMDMSIVYECYSKEIEQWKRKYKLKKLEDAKNKNNG